MAAVIRVKRKRTADPADTLVLSCKRPKQKNQTDSGEGAEDGDIDNLFRFAGTVSTRDAPVEKIQSAIKTARENVKKIGHKSQLKHINSKSRELKKSASLASRYKVVSSHRDLESAKEDTAKSDEKNCHHTGARESTVRNDDETDVGSSLENKESRLQDSTKAAANAGKDVTENEMDRLCCLYDVVQEDAGTEKENVTKRASPDRRKVADQDVLMCNNVQMIREKLTIEDETKPQVIEPEYVYDLYYADPATVDLPALKDIVSIMGYNQDEFVYDGNGEDREYVYGGDDDDDSNDEDNWRNDYPDEDPNYYGDDGDFDYEYGGYHGRRQLSSEDEDYDDDDNLEYRHRKINYEYEVQEYDDYSDDDADNNERDGFIV
ncbi:probable RNA polymerase II nuclear localization protein SLC7A6OS [Ptychodera flava]|uniref:probable RNA polymerase II nuclear localization protein SLC7A6OS n=1 Tax=Ptychodera flava TaxID=63121 RepID=UPI00396A8B0F